MNDRDAYAAACVEECKDLIRKLCAIPAPSHFEDERAEFCAAWMRENIGGQVYVDLAKNAVCAVGDTGSNELVVFAAHTDTVFPDRAPLPFREDAERFYCPGVTDDTANLAVMLLAARQIVRSMPAQGVIIVANSGEEGLGNLCGTRQIFKTYGDRIRCFLTFDGTKLNRIVTNAVGSHRYRVTVQTKGGHSFGNFGNANAIERLSALIADLYCVQVPIVGNSRTTYNVGSISGGTSVNTIAQSAEMLCEYRSDNMACLAQMRRTFEALVEAHRDNETRIGVELIGERPCAKDPNGEAQMRLVNTCAEAIRDVIGEDVVLRSGSTDANIPLSLGVPAVCVTAAEGQGVHTREEWLDLCSLEKGLRLSAEIMESVLKS